VPQGHRGACQKTKLKGGHLKKRAMGVSDAR